MKKFTTIIFILFACNSFAQNSDTIVRKSGTFFNCKILNVTDTLIYYNLNPTESVGDPSIQSPRIRTKKVQLYKKGNVWYNNKSEVVVDPVREVNIGDEMKYVRDNLRRCHNVYSVGIGVELFGMGVIAYGALSGESIGYIAGSGLALVGTLLTVYSHNFIGKAAIGIGGEGLKFRYVL